MLGGEYGWFYRYEVYALSLGWTAVLLVYVTTLDTLTLKARTAALGSFVIGVTVASWALPQGCAGDAGRSPRHI